MGELIQEHKKFIVTHVAGGLVFLILWLIVGGMFNGDIQQNRRRERAANTRAQRSLPAGVKLRDIERGLGEQEQALKRLVGAVARVPDPKFTLRGVSDPDLHYNDVIQEIREDLVEECARRNIEVDDTLGTPTKYPTSRADFAWYLRGLDVVRQVLETVVACDRDVLEEGISRVESIEMKAPARIRTRVAQRDHVTEHRVDFTIVGHPSAVAYVMEEVSRRREGRALVLREARLKSLDNAPGLVVRGPRRTGDPLDVGRVEARFTLASVDVDPEGRVSRKGGVR